MTRRVWIDNDGCPREVREMIFKAAAKRRFPVTVVGNAYTKVPTGITMIVVSQDFDAADNHVAEECGAGDLVITADVPLADRVVGKGAVALSPRGLIFDRENIAEKLATRNLMAELRSGGEIFGGPSTYDGKAKEKFANSFDRLVTKMLNQNQL